MSDTTRPLVSVVIPTYGRSEYLQDAIESVADQTYDRIELLVVDDGSPTPVRETLPDGAFDGIASARVLRHDENQGANVARNTGIEAAEGEYVAFLDDDDYWLETKVEKQVEAFRRADSRVGVVYTGKRTEGSRGSTVMEPSAEGNVIEDILRGAEFGQFSSVMVRADAIEAAGLPDERFPAWQDREWFLRLAKHCHFAAVPEVLTVRRVDLPDRISKQFEQKRDVAYPLFVEKHYSFAREYGLFHARTFLASLRTTLGQTALRAGRYGEARQYFLLAFFTNPLYRGSHGYALALLGGKWSYRSAVFLRKTLAALRSDDGEEDHAHPT